MVTYNRPGAPANPPQHILDEAGLPPGGDIDRTEWKHKAEGTGTGPRDPADPHPSDEEHYGRNRHPGGADSPIEARDIGPNDAVHDGTAPPRPRNATNTRP